MTEASPLDLLQAGQWKVGRHCSDFIPISKDGQQNSAPVPPALPQAVSWNVTPAQVVPQLVEVPLTVKAQKKPLNKLKFIP